jgi:hypothetical protein
MPEAGHRDFVMKHTELRRKLSDYLDDAVSTRDRREIEEHLNGCLRCREALAELKQVVAAIHDIPPVEPPPWLTTRIMARVREETVPRPSLLQRLFSPFPFKIPLEAAVLVCLCVTGYFLATRSAPELAELPSLPRPLENQPQPEKNVLPAGPEQAPQKDRTLIRPTVNSSALPSTVRSGDVSAPAAPSREETGTAPRYPVPRPFDAPVSPAPSTDTIKEEMVLPARSKSLHSAPAPPTARKESRAESSVTSVRDAASPAMASMQITVRVADPVRAGQELEEAIRRVGATIVRNDSTPTGRTVAVRVAIDRLPDLWTRLERLGRITERPSQPDGALGEITVTIRLDAPP